jgi:hypothetical protein
MGRFSDFATCLDCGTKRKVSHKEWIRAARPRCRACGGPIEISQAASDQHAEHDAAKIEADAIKKIKTNRK